MIVIEKSERWNPEYEARVRSALNLGLEVFVLVPWDDPEETPLDAMGRLINEVLDYEHQDIVQGHGEDA